MTGTTPSSPNLGSRIPDDVVAWMESGSTVPAEFIIQAELPRRSVAVNNRAASSHRFAAVSGGFAERQASLLALAGSVRHAIRIEPVVLKSAGAVAIRVLPEELRQISQLPGIREIRFNRKLR